MITILNTGSDYDGEVYASPRKTTMFQPDKSYQAVEYRSDGRRMIGGTAAVALGPDELWKCLINRSIAAYLNKFPSIEGAYQNFDEYNNDGRLEKDSPRNGPPPFQQ